MRISRAALLLAVMAVSACGGKERDISMRDLRTFAAGPDEFMILPSKPLEEPTDFAALPAPTPGGKNLTDRNPRGDAVAALGGRPEALEPGTGVPATDGALVRHTGRHGTPADIRTTLAAEDEDFRRRKSLFTKFKIVREDRYNKAYEGQKLDTYRELERFRRSGISTPSAPPPAR